MYPFEDPALIRQSILETDGGFRDRRAGSPETSIPGTWTLLKNRTSIITNRAQHDIFYLEGWSQPILDAIASTHFAVGRKYLRISAVNGIK